MEVNTQRASNVGRVRRSAGAALACVASSAMSIVTACSGANDSAQAPRPVVTISIQPSDVVRGDTVTIQWAATNATSCKADGEWSGPRPANGSEQLPTRFPGKLLYTLICTGPGGSASNTATVISHKGVSPS